MPRKRPTVSQRKHVTNRANNCCEYCYSQQRYSPDSFEVEHIIPVSLDGKTTLDNLALACGGCNSTKGNRIEGYDELAQSVTPLYHPRHHHWQEHFVWSENYTHLVARTSIGRVTIEMLRLNRTNVINLRRLLSKHEEHPPPPIND
ncbi:MAG: HNH endonuclease [Chloroflexi bacterium]|nr:HNH endonuclease [Chloroflexota bacterium]